MKYIKNLDWNCINSSDEIILVNKTNRKTVFLNEVASDIFNIIDNNTLDEIILSISQLYNREPSQITEEVTIFIGKLTDEKAIYLNEG